ncbi:MAG: hypothetical protein NXI22_02390 [bacterium]|nr:hypothetical protein [bacterium]
MYFADRLSILTQIAPYRRAVRQTALLLITLAIVAQTAFAAPKYHLSASTAGSASETVTSSVTAKGELKTSAEKDAETIPFGVHVQLKAQEHLVYRDGDDWKSLHNYLSGKGEFEVGGRKMNPRMMSNRGLIFADAVGGRLTLYSPLGAITRDYLELIDIPGDANVLAAMLPADAIEVGNQWQPTNAQLAMLLRIETVQKADVVCTFSAIKADEAIVKLAGGVSGSVEGVATEFDIEGEFAVSIKAERITSVRLELSEERQIGEAQPGFSAKTKVQVDRSLCVDPELSNAGVMQVVEREKDPITMMAFQSRGGEYSFAHDRGWRAVVDRGNLTVLRFVDQGDAIAHCRVSLLPDLPEGKELAMTGFQQDVQRSLGDNFSELIRSNEATNASGLKVLRVEAAGVAGEIPIRWICYHVANSKGQRVSIVLTLEEKDIERFTSSEGLIAETFRFPKDANLQAKRDAAKRTSKR